MLHQFFQVNYTYNIHFTCQVKVFLEVAQKPTVLSFEGYLT